MTRSTRSKSSFASLPVGASVDNASITMALTYLDELFGKLSIELEELKDYNTVQVTLSHHDHSTQNNEVVSGVQLMDENNQANSARSILEKQITFHQVTTVTIRNQKGDMNVFKGVDYLIQALYSSPANESQIKIGTGDIPKQAAEMILKFLYITIVMSQPAFEKATASNNKLIVLRDNLKGKDLIRCFQHVSYLCFRLSDVVGRALGESHKTSNNMEKIRKFIGNNDSKPKPIIDIGQLANHVAHIQKEYDAREAHIQKKIAEKATATRQQNQNAVMIRQQRATSKPPTVRGSTSAPPPLPPLSNNMVASQPIQLPEASDFANSEMAVQQQIIDATIRESSPPPVTTSPRARIYSHTTNTNYDRSGNPLSIVPAPILARRPLSPMTTRPQSDNIETAFKQMKEQLLKAMMLVGSDIAKLHIRGSDFETLVQQCDPYDNKQLITSFKRFIPFGVGMAEYVINTIQQYASTTSLPDHMKTELNSMVEYLQRLIAQYNSIQSTFDVKLNDINERKHKRSLEACNLPLLNPDIKHAREHVKLSIRDFVGTESVGENLTKLLKHLNGTMIFSDIDKHSKAYIDFTKELNEQSYKYVENTTENDLQTIVGTLDEKAKSVFSFMNTQASRSSEDPMELDGGATKLVVLGRKRSIHIVKGRQYVTVQGDKMLLSKALKLDKQNKKQKEKEQKLNNKQKKPAPAKKPRSKKSK